MSIKDEVTKRGMKMMSDPRFAKLVQNPQFLKAVMVLMQVPGKVNTFTNEQAERLASSLKLATAKDVADLKKSVRKLERELERLQQRSNGG